MAKGDWVKLHRKALDSVVFSDPDLWRLWSWCMMKANWKDSAFMGNPVKRGQFATGRKSAAEKLEISESKWYRDMKKLESLDMIKMEPNNKFTVVTLLNHRIYQDFDDENDENRTTSEQPANNQRTTSEQPANTIEELTRKKEVKKRAVAISKPDDVSETSWDDWLAVRKAKRGCAVTQTVMNGVLREAAKAGVTLEHAVSKAAERNWLTYNASWDQGDTNDKPKQETFGQMKMSNTRAAVERARRITEESERNGES